MSTNSGFFRKLHEAGQLPLLFAVWVKGRDAMSGKQGQRELQSRIRTGKLTREDVARRLAELAFGQANDCVKLVLDENVQVTPQSKKKKM